MTNNYSFMAIGSENMFIKTFFSLPKRSEVSLVTFNCKLQTKY